ncbi:hypothetical protein GCM10027084_26980 [Pseudoxanthomonas sangjuensis]|nr:hypothetical protein CSC71_03885 [Pseudoxanthomonas sangjuensis]
MGFTPNSNQDCMLAWEAMPDALQGALTPRQSEWLDGHLARCDACRAQFAQQQRLQRAMSLPVDLPIDAEAGLKRLLSRIDNPDLAKAPEPSRPVGWAGRALVAAIVLQAIGLGAMGAKLWSLESAPAYRTLSREAAPAPAGSIRLVPDPAMELADWNALLDASGLRVVEGPNKVGGYLVVPTTEAVRREALLQRLRSTRGILLAEPVAGTP